MPRSKRNKKVELQQNGKVSMEPILQDYSITSLSDITSDVLPPSDSSLFEDISNYDVALPNVTHNQTDDVNLTSDLYPPDTTMMDITKINTPTPLFRKPFNTRSKKKPRPSLFDNDIQDSENETPTPKIRRPFQRKDKVPIDSEMFDHVFDSSNDSITQSHVDTNFITRRKMRGKKNVDNNLFDEDLNSSESDVSFSAHRVLPRHKIRNKNVLDQVKEFDQIIDNTLNGSLTNQSACNELPFNRLKNKIKNVETSLFDNDLNSSDSHCVKLENSAITKQLVCEEKDESNISQSKELPFKSLVSKEKKMESNLFDSDLNSSYSLQLSSSVLSCDRKGGESVSIVCEENQQSNNNDLSESIRENIPDETVGISSLEMEVESNQNIEESSLSVSKISDVSKNDTKDKSSLPLEINLSQQSGDNSLSMRRDNSVSKNDSENNMVKVHENQPDKESRLSVSKVSDVSKNDTKVHSCNPLPEVEPNQHNKENNLSSSKNTTVGNHDPEEKSSPPGGEVEVYQHNTENSLSNNRNSNCKSKHDTKEIISNSLGEVVTCKNESIQTKTVNHSPALSQETLLSTQVTDDKERGTHLDCPLHISFDNLEVENIETTESNKNLTHECDNVKDNTLPDLGLEKSELQFEEQHANGQNEETECKNSSAIYSNLLNQNNENSSERKLQNPSSIVQPTRLTEVVDIVIQSSGQETLLNGDSFINMSTNVLEHSSHLMVKDLSKRSEITRSSGRKSGPSPEIEISKARDAEHLLINNDIITEDLLISDTSYMRNDIKRLSHITRQLGKISYEAADTSNPTLKKRRVSFLCDIEDVNRSMGKRKSNRKSIINNSNLTNQQSTSKINDSQLSKSGFSLFIEQSSNSVSSGSEFIDIHPSQIKNASSSLNAELNSSCSNQPNMPISAREHGNTLNTSTRVESDNSLVNESHQTTDKVELTETEAESKQEKEISVEEEEITEEHSTTNYVSDKEMDDEEHEEESQEDETEVESKEENEISDEEEEITEELSTTNYVTDKEMEDEESDEEYQEDETEEKIQEEKEGTIGDLTERRTESESDEIQQNEGINVKEFESIENAQLSLHQNSVHTAENGCDSLAVSSRTLQESNFSFKLPKKTVRKQRVPIKPLAQPLNDTKLLQILDNMPYSELRRKRKKSIVPSKFKEQSIVCEKEKIRKKAVIVSNKSAKPAKWVSPKFHLFITNKLLPHFGIRSRVKAEEVINSLVEYVNRIMDKEDNYYEIVEEMKRELANYGIVETHMDFNVLVRNYFHGYFNDKLYPIHSDVDGNPFEPDDLFERIL